MYYPNTRRRASRSDESDRPDTTARIGRCGAVAISAWLLTAVTTGYGVATAEESPSGPSSGGASTSSDSNDAAGENTAGQPDSNADDNDPQDDADITVDEDTTDDEDTADDEDANTDDANEANDEDTAVGVVPGEPEVVTVDPGMTAPVAVNPPSPDSRATRASSSSPAEDETVVNAAPVPNTIPVEESMSTAWSSNSDPITAESTAPMSVTPASITTTSLVPTPFAAASITTRAAPATPLEIFGNVVTDFIATFVSPLIVNSSAPEGDMPFAWAVLAFVRRNFFNQAPTVTEVTINPGQSSGVITGDIDATDPDELGKKVKVVASVFAGAPTPTDCACAQIEGQYFFGAFTNPAVLGENDGDNWHAPNAVDNTCVYADLADFTKVTYTGTETGVVSIDGLGTGEVHLDFVGVLNAEQTSERSVAQLDPDRGTGDLKGVTGTVISESALNADRTATGVLTGEVVRPEIRYVVVRQPEHGTVVVDDITGQFVYTADPGFAHEGGADSFEVLVTDNRFNVLKVFSPYNGDRVQRIDLTVYGATNV